MRIYVSQREMDGVVDFGIGSCLGLSVLMMIVSRVRMIFEKFVFLIHHLLKRCREC